MEDQGFSSLPSSVGDSADTVTILVSQDPIDSSVLEKLSNPRVTEGEERKVAPVAYVTNVSLASVCLCCTGQQARRCSLNVGESGGGDSLGGRGLWRRKRLRKSGS